MDQREGNTDRFLLRLHPAIHFSKSLLPIFSSSTRPGSVDPSVHCHPPLSPPSDAPTADVAARARLRLPTSLPTHRHRLCPLPASTAFIHAIRCLQQRPRSSGSKAPPNLHGSTCCLSFTSLGRLLAFRLLLHVGKANEPFTLEILVGMIYNVP
ncbi:hypothetical protein ACLOJK_004073 [Asimina triloba]